MYSERRILPTLSNIQTAMQEDIDYTGGKSILRKYMRQLGFTYKKSQTNRKLLMERGDVVLSRIRYLRKIRQLRQAELQHSLHRRNLCTQLPHRLKDLARW